MERKFKLKGHITFLLPKIVKIPTEISYLEHAILICKRFEFANY